MKKLLLILAVSIISTEALQAKVIKIDKETWINSSAIIQLKSMGLKSCQVAYLSVPYFEKENYEKENKNEKTEEHYVIMEPSPENNSVPLPLTDMFLKMHAPIVSHYIVRKSCQEFTKSIN